jgi:hypothetical protein
MLMKNKSALLDRKKSGNKYSYIFINSNEPNRANLIILNINKQTNNIFSDDFNLYSYIEKDNKIYLSYEDYDNFIIATITDKNFKNPVTKSFDNSIIVFELDGEILYCLRDKSNGGVFKLSDDSSVNIQDIEFNGESIKLCILDSKHIIIGKNIFDIKLTWDTVDNEYKVTIFGKSKDTLYDIIFTNIGKPFVKDLSIPLYN